MGSNRSIRRGPVRWASQLLDAGTLLLNSMFGVAGGIPGPLNDDGELVGPIICTAGTAAEIEAMTGTEGEIWYKNDTKTFGVFDGSTSGGTEIGWVSVVGNMVSVQPKSTATANAAALRVAYNLAKTLTPYGNAISATNPVWILLYPGIYDFGTGDDNYHGLEINTPYIHLVGVSSDAKSVVITSTRALTADHKERGTIEQTADNVEFHNITMELNWSGSPLDAAVYSYQTNPSGGAYAYYPNTDLSGTVLRNVRFSSSNRYSSTRTGIEYSGTYDRLDTNGIASVFDLFSAGEFSGTITDTDFGSSAFRTTGTISGMIKRCNFGDYAMYSSSLVGATIEDCTFGSNGLELATLDANTILRRIQAGNNFVYGKSGGSIAALFEDVTVSGDGIGGFVVCDLAGARGRRCIVTGAGFGSRAADGEWEDCHGGSWSFLGVISSASTLIMRRCRVTTTSGDALMNFKGLMEDCVIETTDTNKNAVNVASTARIYNSTLVANGTGKSVYAAASQNAKIAHCRMNNGIHANVTNLIETPYNVDDTDVSV